MAYIKWNDEFLVNLEPFDSQHKRLVSLMNTLYDQFKVGKTSDELNTFTSFMGFAKEHFLAEEAIMSKYNYPDFESHRVEHKVLIHVLKGYEAQIIEKGFSMEVLEMLKRWLLDHIMNLDKKYGAFLNGKEIK